MLRRPNDVELRKRLRGWMVYFIRVGKLQEPKITQENIAEAVGISPSMVSLIKTGVEQVGLDTFAGMHFGLGGDPWRMLNREAPTTDEEPTMPPIRLTAKK